MEGSTGMSRDREMVLWGYSCIHVRTIDSVSTSNLELFEDVSMRIPGEYLRS